MPIGKDSIQKRVAKTTALETEADVTVAETAEATAPTETAPKPAPKKRAPVKKADTAQTAESKAGGNAPVAPKKAPAKPKAVAKTSAEPSTTVMGNVSPETVEKVIGHAEGTPSDHVQIGSKMPHYLL